jgi:mannosylglycoprotein endo-beta-mannosidase
MKWRWRLLDRGDSALWKEVLVAKYGPNIVNNANLPSEAFPNFASLWWKDARNLEVGENNSNWVVDNIVRRLGNGLSIRFWKEVWIGDSPLCLMFPRLFSLSLQKDACIGELLLADGERRRWNFNWRRNLFQWEVDRVNVLVGLLVNVNLSHLEDGWIWKANPEEGFSVKSAYDMLMVGVVTNNLTTFELKVFSDIWESPAPSKVVAFSWQLFHNRIPSRVNLFRRGVLNLAAEVNCVWCVHYPESANHLFLHCNLAHRVWYEVFKWLGLVIVMPPSIMVLFASISDDAKNKRIRRGFRLVWHSVVWSLWRARNNAIFNNIIKEPLEIVEEVKVLSWRWSVDCLKISPCLFYEWTWDPGDCMGR